LILSGGRVQQGQALSGEQMGLPSGRPFREAFEGGDPGEIVGRDPYRAFKKEWIPSWKGLNSGKPLLVTYSDAGKQKRLRPWNRFISTPIAIIRLGTLGASCLSGALAHKITPDRHSGVRIPGWTILRRQYYPALASRGARSRTRRVRSGLFKCPTRRQA